MSGPWASQHLHLIGIGGAGMSAYARCALALGATVSGSDQAESPALAALRELGIDARGGHDPANVPAAGDGVEVFHSTAIVADNAERVAAAARGIPDHPRAELLRRFSALKRTIAVAGAHGKTTTTSMIAHALLQLGAEPAYLIGGDLVTTGRNGEWGTGEWLVVEADESDGSFLSIEADIAVVTNVELDHHATYPSLAAVQAVFREFLAAPPHAVLWDRPDVLMLRAGGDVVPFDAPAEPLRLLVPGEHNQRNAAAALEALALAGFDRDAAAAALATFPGAGRRFQTLGVTSAGARIVDDYAHHPTEVAATIQAARSLAPSGRVVAIFQAHLFSRTVHLAGRFGAALAGADVACLVDIYPAREKQEDFPGVTGRLLVERTLDARPGMPVFWLPAFDDVERALAPLLRDGDLVLVMGAGDVHRLGARLAAL